MALHSFCGILTLQVGVAMIAVVFWTIAALTFVVNFFEFIDSVEFPLYSITITTFVILLTMGGLIAFFAAYNESNGLCMAGVALTALTTVVWVTISSFSFYNDAVFLQFVCIHDRCPETFWLAPLKYRLESTTDNKAVNNMTSPDYLSNNFTANASTPDSPSNNPSEGRKKRVVDVMVLSPLILDQYKNVDNKAVNNMTSPDYLSNNFTANASTPDSPSNNPSEGRKKRVVDVMTLSPLILDQYKNVDNKVVNNMTSPDYLSNNFTANASTPDSPSNNPSEGRKKRVVDVMTSPLILDQYKNVKNGTEFHNDELWNPKLNEVLYYLDDNSDEIISNDVTKSGYNFGIPLIGAVVLFICNFFFFLFSILVLWSYGQELAWTNEYLSDIPEYASP